MKPREYVLVNVSNPINIKYYILLQINVFKIANNYIRKHIHILMNQ